MPDERAPSFLPRYPTLIALALFLLWVLVLCFPMLSGHFLGSQYSDQMWNGIPFRTFWLQEFHRTGSIPLWDPYLFGGLPFAGAMHGDMFYPTSFLRIFLRADQALDAVFAIHLFLAGAFTYAFLRQLGRTWTAAVVGGLAYQLSGIVASQVSPGHDGKMIVSSLLPLLLTGLLIGIRKRRMEGYALTALVIGLDLLSPQTQTTQYSLIFAGLWTLYLCFYDDERPDTGKARLTALGLATLAVVLGFGVAMIQYVPFIKYGPYAARVAGAQGWEYATAYSMPPKNIFDWLLGTFTGSHAWGNYWVGQLIKLHSEYVGAAVLGLVVLGVAKPPSRKLTYFLAGVWLLFLLVCLGSATPFYRLWYAVVPGVKVTRAPGMAFFIPTFIFAIFASFGVERLERREGKGLFTGFLVAGGVLLLLGLTGGIVSFADSLAGEAYSIVDDIAPQIRQGTVIAGLALAALGGLGMLALRERMKALALALGLCAIVSVDLFLNARRFFIWNPPETVLYAPDSIVSHIAQTPKPYRVLDLPVGGSTVYPTNFLMYHDIPQVLGQHGNELHAWDELLGGKPNGWPNAGSVRLWDLLGVRYLLLPQPINVPGYHAILRTDQVAGNAIARRMAEAILYEADTIPQYARVLPAAVKVPESQIVPLLMNPRFDYSRVLLLPESASVNPPRVDTLPAASPSRATVTEWEPGSMKISVAPAPATDSWLLVSENWYPDWRATVDGAAVTPLRGQGSLLAIPLKAGAHDVTFTFSRDVYNKGKLITLLSLAVIAAWFALPLVRRRRA